MDKMIIESFRKYMGKSNRQLFGWIFTWITSVLMFCISTKSESVTFEKLDGFNTALAVILLLIAVNMYIDKYSKFYGSKDMDRTEDLALLRNESVTDIMKSHSFNMGLYFKALYIKLVPIQIASAVLLGVAGAFKVFPMTNAVIFVGVMLAAPGLMIFMRYLVADYELDHSFGLGRKIVYGLFKGIYSFARIFVVGVSFIMLGTLALAVFSSNTVMKGVDDSVPVSFTSNTGIFLIIMFVAAILLCLFLTDTDKELLVSSWVKVRNVLMIVSIATIIVTAAIYTYVYKNSNVMLTENSITVNNYGTKTEYTLDDIESYRVYYKQGDDAMDMEVTFKDGHVETLFKGNSDSTNAWSDKYLSDYHYAYDLMCKLADRGIVGTIDDKDKIEKTVSGYDERIYEAYHDMIRVVSE
jgi:hypothetical protein